MSENSPAQFLESTPELKPGISSTFPRIWKYVAVRFVTLAVMVIAGIFISIFVINYGGQLDKIYEAQIIEAVPRLAANYPNLTYEQRAPILAQIKWDWEESLGLHEPFLLRCLRWTAEAIVFNSQDPAGTGNILGGGGPGFLPEILAKFPKTLLLVGSTNVLVFLLSLSFGLFLSKRQGDRLDKLMSSLVPLSSIPNWAYAILLTAIFAWGLNILPAQGTLDMFPPKHPIGYVWIVFKHMILPMSALLLSIFFQMVYTWRSLFLVNAGEDYVELARAKGLPEKMIERRYLLKPTMPYIITSFALFILSMWQGIIILETFFRWDGIGQYFGNALSAISSSAWGKLQAITLIVIFIYLMALTVFLLDIIYVLVDPRIKIGGQERTLHTTVREKNILVGLFKKREEFSSPRNIQEIPSFAEKRLPDLKMKVLLQKVRQEFQNMAGTLSPVMKKPSAVIGMTIIAILLGLTIFTAIFIPYDTAISLWSPVTGSVFNNPRLVQPVWTNLFRRYAYPLTIRMQSGDAKVVHQELFAPNTVGLTKYTFKIDYPYSVFPQDLSIRLNTQFKTLPSLVTFTWITPDGRSYELGKITVNNDKLFIVNQDLPGKLTRLFGLEARVNALGKEAFMPVEVLFASPDVKKIETVKGTYQLVASVQNFEKDATVTVSMVLYGKVFGLAGTDLNRRDLLVPLLWGIPVALVFGVVGATLTILFSLFIAAVSAWKGGWIDSLIQRISEINLVIPIIPFGIMVFYLFKESIWAVLAVFVIFNIFGASLKNFRAALIQIKEAPYIEAALSYGASDWRIIWHYLVPHLLPMVIPQLIIMIPAYIFLEASMAFFGVVDPILPTWGKLIYEAFNGGALHGDYYWILEPVGMIVLVGLAFTLLGSALDDVLNPRLRKT